MSRGLQCRGVDRTHIRETRKKKSGRGRARASSSAGPDRLSSLRLIGQPIAVTIPSLKGVRCSYCSRWDQQPAAQLAKIFLRLGISRIEDWSGSPVDFLECGLKRFLKTHGSVEAARVWDGNLTIADHQFELTERQSYEMRAEMERPNSWLFLMADYNYAAPIPIGATFRRLQSENGALPPAFYRVLVENLGKWMPVYDIQSALEHAEMWMDGMDDEELTESLYPKVRKNIPSCLSDASKGSHAAAFRTLKRLRPTLKDDLAKRLVDLTLEMDSQGTGHDHCWPEELEAQVPGMEEFLSDADGCIPGCVISWHEGDEINACFDEEVNSVGQNGFLEPSTMLKLPLGPTTEQAEPGVERAFDHAQAMLRSLACAASIVELIREVNDECVGKHRLEQRVQAEPGPAGVRQI